MPDITIPLFIYALVVTELMTSLLSSLGLMAKAPIIEVGSTNKQWKTGQNGLDKLKLEEGDVPSPKDGEVLVKISAVSLNYRDTEGLNPSGEPPGTTIWRETYSVLMRPCC